MDKTTRRQLINAGWQFPKLGEPIGARQLELLMSDKPKALLDKYMSKVESLLAQRFGDVEGVKQAVAKGRVQRQIPDYVADWRERFVIDEEVVAQLNYDSYFVKE